MIQRKQTLFLLELLFLSIALLFVPNSSIVTHTGAVSVCLLPLPAPFISTTGHYVAMALNFAGLALTLLTIFSYKRRELQARLCYSLIVIWALIGFMTGFWTFAEQGVEVTEVQTNYSGVIISVFAILAAVLAARFIRKDIDLIKSADRIR